MLLDILKDYWHLIDHAISMSPLLLIAVFVIVEFISSIFRIKEMSNRWRDSLLGLLCLLTGVMVTALAFTNYPLYKVLHNGVILGSLSAITYQIFKPAFKIFKDYILNKLEKVLKIEGS